MKRQLFFLPAVILMIFSCNQRSASEKLDAETYNHYLETGSEISAQAQSALLSNVSEAMKQGGTLYAVEFCNLKASGITDSLNNLYNCTISRVSAKNRNPENYLSNATEEQLWEYFLSVHETEMIHDTIVMEEQQPVYYKPILTAMQACLQCHGPKDKIDPATYSKIRELYPEDKATGYELNELRGMWKIEFEHENEMEGGSTKSTGILTGVFKDL